MPVEALRRPMQARVEAPRRAVMPLSFLPEARSRIISPELASVAGHELNHALIALAHGVPVASVSVVPSGDSLGRTTLGGSVSDEALKVIAAGGGCDTHEGSARGYGSDKYKVDYLHHFHGGQSWESARSRASSIVSMYSRDVRRKAAEIIAYLRNVSGSMLGEIMKRAQMEINEEKGGQIEELPVINIPEQKYEGYTIIDNLPNNISRITYIGIKKDKEEKKYLCGVCHGVNAHAEKCPNAKLSLDPKEKLPIKKYVLPKEGTIFSRN